LTREPTASGAYTSGSFFKLKVFLKKMFKKSTVAVSKKKESVYYYDSKNTSKCFNKWKNIFIFTINYPVLIE
jgi:hypothetical protein